MRMAQSYMQRSSRAELAPASRSAELARRILVAIEAFLALSGIAGGSLLVLFAVSGNGPMAFDAKYLDGSPFQSYLLPGLFLTTLGVAAGVAAMLHMWGNTLAPYASFVVGCLMMVFELIESVLVPFSFLQPTYFLVGLVVAALSLTQARDLAKLGRVSASGSKVLGWRLALVVVFCLLAVYAAAIRPWLLNWGSTAQERQMSMPGEELQPHPTWKLTRAITIHAPADVVWAWLIQHGQDRAGFYSYDWLENLTGADIHNVDELRPEWRARQTGEGIPMARPFFGSRINATVLRVDIAEPGTLLVTTSAAGDVAIRQLVPIDAATTRLIFRDQEGTGSPSLLDRGYRFLVWEPAHFVMQHGMLLGIQTRAEGRLHDPAVLFYAAKFGWIAGTLAIASLLVSSRRQRVWLLAPVLATVPAIVLAGDLNAAMAGFIAAGLTTAGAVRWGWRWWPSFALIGYLVLLLLLLTADAYLGFGLLFAAVLLVYSAGWIIFRQGSQVESDQV